jgi:hypothetical protein
MKLATPGEILLAVSGLVDDGFCRRSDLVPLFPKLGERDLRRSIKRAVALGLLVERRGPDARIYLALSGEGWDRLRSEQA